jgi:nucleoside 2-deoxyribosyltransferase
MIITLCGSTNFYDEMDNIQSKLEEMGHIVNHPKHTSAKFDPTLEGLHTNPKHKDDMSVNARLIKNKLITSHMLAIKNSDAVIAVNLEKNGQENYIGGNTFLEMGFAFAFDKKIFIWKELPMTSTYIDEITGMLPTVIREDCTLLV